jgi:hypothetical protein
VLQSIVNGNEKQTENSANQDYHHFNKNGSAVRPTPTAIDTDKSGTKYE